MKLTLYITHKCNLKCKYCYVDQQLNRDMTLRVARKSVDFGLKNTNKEYFRVGFFGGEALLKFELLKDIVNYSNLKSKEVGLNPLYVLSTNGLILNTEITKFLHTNKFRISLSLDGAPITQNLNRGTFTKEGSFEIVYKNFKSYVKHGFPTQVISVVDPTNVQYLSDNIKFLSLSGANYVLLSPNLMASWTKETLDIWFEEYEKAIQFIESENNNKVFYNFINKSLEVQIPGGHAPEDTIKTGARLSIDFKGDIFTCDRIAAMVDNKIYRLGNTQNPQRLDFQKLEEDFWRLNGCEKCTVPYCCGKFSRYIQQNCDKDIGSHSLASEYNQRVFGLNQRYKTKLNYLEMSIASNKIKLW